MHHPEQPPLPGVVNAGVWRELAARRDAHVRAVADPRVHVIGLLLEVDQVGGNGGDRRIGETDKIRRIGAERRPSQQMLHLPVESRHTC